MFGIIASSVACAVMNAAAEGERIRAELDSLPPLERKERVEFYARRAHESRMERLAQQQAEAAQNHSSGFMAFIFGMIVGGGGS